MLLKNRAVALALMVSATGLALADFDGPAPVAWRWAESTSVPPTGEPQVDGDTVYSAVGGRIYAIERTTGNTKWRYPAGEPISGNFRQGCALGAGVIVAPGDDSSVYAVNVDGTLAWQHLSNDPIVTNPVVAGNTVVFGTSKEELVALDARTGQPVWSENYEVQDGLGGKLGKFEENVIVTSRRGNMISLNPVTKRENWATKFTRLSPQGAFTVFGDRIYVNSGSFLVCLRGFSGQTIWQQNVGRTLDLAPAASVDGVATISREGRLYSYNLTGRPLFPAGVDLQAAPIASPSFVGRFVCTVMTNGTVNLIDPQTGDAIWNYTMSPLVRASSAPSSGGPGGPGGAVGGPGGGLAGPGGGPGQNNQDAAEQVDYVQAAGQAVGAGDSLVVMARDGSIFLFDKNLGVDLTAPVVEQVWPQPGNVTAGKAPMELVYKVEDTGIGVDPSSIKVTIDGTEYIAEFLREGYIRVSITVRTVNKPLTNGRKTMVVSVADWLGNRVDEEMSIVIDNSLPAAGRPRDLSQDNNRGGGPGGAGGRGGGALGDGL